MLKLNHERPPMRVIALPTNAQAVIPEQRLAAVLAQAVVDIRTGCVRTLFSRYLYL